jgi:hypothetical protein
MKGAQCTMHTVHHEVMVGSTLGSRVTKDGYRSWELLWNVIVAGGIQFLFLNPCPDARDDSAQRCKARTTVNSILEHCDSGCVGQYWWVLGTRIARRCPPWKE